MTASADWPLGLARLAALVGRDLQRPSRAVGGPVRLWKASNVTLVRALSLDGQRAREVVAARRAIDVGRARIDLDRQAIRFVGRPEPGFPVRLGAIYDPPFGIFAVGRVDEALTALALRPVIAVVGSRRATPAGVAMARELGRGLAARGAVVVSGLAVGVDGAAHQGALAGGGLTVAVAGCGADVPYPRRNRLLAQRIAVAGARLSEYWPGTPPAPWRFPARNRLVAGLADAVVVVEAGTRSGSLITAEFALELGRSVLAVPGPPGSEAVAGCHGLLRDGAALCEGVDDVVAETEACAWGPAVGPSEPATADAEGVAGRALAVLRSGPRSPDALAAQLGATSAQMAVALAMLEIDGRVVRGEAGAWWAAPSRAPG